MAFVPAGSTTTHTMTSAIPPSAMTGTGHVGFITEKKGIKGHHTVMHPVIVTPAAAPSTQIIQPVINTPPPPPPRPQQPVVVQQPPVNIHIDNPNAQPQGQQQAAAQQPAQQPAPTTIINNKP